MTDELKSQGLLRSLDPHRLIDQQQKDNVAGFFLVLALYYNDLKSLLYHYNRTNEAFEGTSSEDISIQAGEFGGIRAHLLRLMASTVFEFLEFLKTNRSVLGTAEFRLVYESLNRNLKEQWNLIVQIASKGSSDVKSDFSSALMLVRNNLGFHYNQSSKALTQAFIDHFFKDQKNISNEKAYFSDGTKMKDVRFFYSDAAAQRAVISQAQKKLVSADEYYEKLMALIKMTNFTIMQLLKRYLKQRPPYDSLNG